MINIDENFQIEYRKTKLNKKKKKLLFIILTILLSCNLNLVVQKDIFVNLIYIFNI